MELLVISLVSLIVSLFNSAHVILQWSANKPGEVFTAIPHFFADYFLYVGAMAQGVAGRWIWAEHLFTNEPMSPTWYYWFYVSLGHIGSWVRLSPFATYNVSLIILVFLLCLTWYALAKLLYPTNIFLRLTTWLFILTVTNFTSFARPGLTKLNLSNIEMLGQFWFSPAPVFNRLGGVPYHAAQMILFILLAILFSRLMASQTYPRKDASSAILLVIGNWKLAILAAIAASANPVQMLVFGLAATATTVIATGPSRQRKTAVIALLGVGSGAGAWITNQEFARQAVFLAARAWEFGQFVVNSPSNLLLSMGPIIMFVPFGIRIVLKHKHPLSMLLIIWGLLSFVLFLSPIPRLMALSPVRFLHPVPYAAALSFLGAEGLAQLAGMLHRRVKNIITINHIRAGLMALYFLLTIPAVSKQFMDRITPARNPQLLMDTIYNHVPAPITEALSWLKVTGPGPVSNPVVLTDPAIPIEVLVPVFTGLPSFSGHPIHTLYPDVKEAKRQEFFVGKMRETEAKQFLKDHRIGFIITTPSRRLPINLRKEYSNTIVSIYESANDPVR